MCCESHLREGNTYQFPTLAKQNGEFESDSFADELKSLIEQFGTRFRDFRTQELNMKIFSSTFDADVRQAPAHLQMELIDIQEDSDLKSKMKDVSLTVFYQLYFPVDKYPRLAAFARRRMAQFGSTYVCEQFFSRMNFVKSRTRTRLTDCHLENCLRVATSSIPPDMDRLVMDMKCQKSHYRRWLPLYVVIKLFLLHLNANTSVYYSCHIAHVMFLSYHTFMYRKSHVCLILHLRVWLYLAPGSTSALLSGPYHERSCTSHGLHHSSLLKAVHNETEIVKLTFLFPFQLLIDMPEIRCPGYPKCKRHFKYVMGMKGHAVGCQFASKHILKQPPSHPGHRLGTKAAEYVVFGENHEIGNDKICRQGITIYTPACFYKRPYCDVYWRPIEEDVAVNPCPKVVSGTACKAACKAASTGSLVTACRPTVVAETACKAACKAANSGSLVTASSPNVDAATACKAANIDSLVTACRPTVVAETACKAANMDSLVTACRPTVMAETTCRPMVVDATACRPTVVAETACRPTAVAGTACRPTVVAETACRPTVEAETACRPMVVAETACRPTVVDETVFKAACKAANTGSLV